MTLLAFASAKGSPGVTTAVVALAAVWPAPAVLADCDPAGGDVALRLTDPDGRPLWRDRGLVALVAQAGRSSTPEAVNAVNAVEVGGYLQTARGGLMVLAGLESAAQATAITPAWSLIGQQLRAFSVGQPVLADCGRLDPASPVAQVWRRADLLVLCAHPRPDSLVHLRHTLQALSDGTAPPADATGGSCEAVPPVVVVVIDDGGTPDAVDQVHAALQVHPPTDTGSAAGATVRVVGGLAHDPVGAAGLAGTPTRRLDRCPLIGSARALAPLLADLAVGSMTARPDRSLPLSAQDRRTWPAEEVLPATAAPGGEAPVIATGAVR